MSRLLYPALGALLFPILFAVGGCSPYVDGFRYVPRPAYIEIPPAPPEQVPPVSASVSIIGVRRDDRQAGIPTSVEVRMRVDNNGGQPVVFDPTSLELTNGVLTRFPRPLVQPPRPVTLVPGESVYLSAYFPMPGNRSYDEVELDSLQLRWLVTINGHRIGQVVNFRRVYHVYYYRPYWDYPPGLWVGGVVVVHRRF